MKQIYSYNTIATEKQLMRVFRMDPRKIGAGRNRLFGLKETNKSLDLILVTFAFLASVTGCFAQTATKNYITTYHPQVVVTNEWAVPVLAKESGQKSITYFDGLGRPSQVIQVSGSPNGYDMIVPIKYDAFGRETRKFLPYSLTIANSGAYVTADSIGQSSYYTGLYGSTEGANAFANTVFEPSPLNRLLKQGAPGAPWQPNTIPTSDHSKKSDYGTNHAMEVKLWTVVNNTLTDNGFYAPNTLYKTTTWDENNKQDTTVSRTIEYKDLLGKVVLKVSCDGTTKYPTYYVYDDLENLRFVIPPKAAYDNVVTSNEMDSLCYQYRYDSHKRMVKKKIPGADSTIMVYDARDRLVLTQDGVLRPTNKWYFTKYDEINRPVITGCLTLTGISADTLRARFARYTTTLYESKVSTGNIGYSLNSSYPSNVSTTIDSTSVLAITYYDNYTLLSVSGFKATSGQFNKFNRTYTIDTAPDNDGNNNGYFDYVNGHVTGTKVKILDGNEYTTSAKWLCSMNFYNDRYRLIQNKQTLYSGGAVGADTLIVSNLYDFMGKVLQTKQVQTFGGVTTITDKFYTFDHLARLTTSAQQITGDAANGKVNVALNTYNESGQLIDKKLHGANSLGYLQYVDYTYNIRGWLTSINNPDNLAHSTDPVDLFGERLDYNATETGLNSSYPSQYNGNISAMVWTSANKPKRGYAFTYDGLNRLTFGDFKGYNAAWVDSTNYEEKSLAYDMNGNISQLVRTNSTGGTMANYTYRYTGNRLATISGGTAYTYDLNGNTTLDGLRGFTIAYNSINLPKSITSGTDNIAYIYSAAGEKLAKKMKDNTYHYYAGNMMFNTDKSLNYLLFDEGLVNKVSGGYAYEYHIKDHLGNTRIAFQPNGSATTVTQVAEYYPFGSSYLPILPAGTNKYLYNGKEEQDDVLGTGSTALDWYDYGARFYDPQIGRWNSVDPLAEKSRKWSPYNYCVNNPMRFIDPDGMFQDDYKLNNDGNPEFVKTTKSKTDELYATNKDGSINKDKSVSVKKGTFNNPVKSKDGETTGFKTDNVDDAKKVFKFEADISSSGDGSSPVEHALINFEQDGKSQAALVTDGAENYVSGSSFANELAKDGADIKDVTHNHPDGTPPSGYTATGKPDGTNTGDFRVTNEIGGKEIKRHVYTPQKSMIYEYDKKGFVGSPSSSYFGF